MASESGESGQQQPKAKRQRCGRVALDVGGGKFVTSASTLTSNSHYFAALLSGDWSDSGDEELYIDQDPAFKVLLDYMRSGMIQVAEVNEKVLMLAEFLGMERLVSAAKVRWFAHLGRGPNLSDDCSDADIVAAFDKEYGGISEAIGAGLFPSSFLVMNPLSKCQCEVADIMLRREGGGNALVAREFVGREGPIETECGALGAINGLCSKGYVGVTDYDEGWDDARLQLLVLRRRKYIQLLPRTEDVFVPSDVTIDWQKVQWCGFSTRISSTATEVDGIRMLTLQMRFLPLLSSARMKLR